MYTKPGTKWERERLLIAAIIGFGLLCLIGGGAYAALGGATRTANTADIELQKGLVGWWKMDGNMKDATPNQNNGSVVGATLTADRKGTTNAAYALDGNSQYNTIPDATSLNPGSVTVSFWFKLTRTLDCDGNNNYVELIRKYASLTGAATGWDVVLEENNNLTWDLGTNNVAYQNRLQVSAGVTLNTPVYLSFTYDATSKAASIYANGVLKGTTTFANGTSILTNTDPIRVGRGSLVGTCPNGAGYVPGVYDDLRLYNRAISQPEAAALYNQYDPGVRAAAGESGLVADWQFNGNTKDSTPNALSLTNNGATLTTDRKGRASSAYSYNGSAYMTATSAALKAVHNSGEVSYEIWFYYSGNTNVLFSRGNGFTCEYEPVIGPTEIDLSGCSNSGSVISFSPLSNKWNHLVFTIDNAGDSIKTYLNGSLISTKTVTQVKAASNTSSKILNSISNDVYVGAGYNSSTGVGTKYSGSIGEVRVYNRPLSATEVSGHYAAYNSQVQVSDLQKGLVGDWPMNGNAKDATPYGNNGTVSGATLATDRKGRANSAYSFSGTTQYIQVPAVHKAAAGSISLWVKLASSQPGSYYIFSHPQGGTNSRVYITTNSTGTNISVALGNGTNIGTATGTANSWHHIVVTWSGTSASYYYDGQTNASNVTFNGLTDVGAVSSIGCSVDGTQCVNGSIDDVRIWSRVLSATEVTSLYKLYR